MEILFVLERLRKSHGDIWKVSKFQRFFTGLHFFFHARMPQLTLLKVSSLSAEFIVATHRLLVEIIGCKEPVTSLQKVLQGQFLFCSY